MPDRRRRPPRQRVPQSVVLSSCVFCHRSDPEIEMNDEHVFADWVSVLFGDITGFAETWTAESIDDTWTGTAFQDTLRIVCDKCNSGWMSGQEKKVSQYLKPMMKRGAITGLPPRLQQKVAAWAIKTAMVADYLPPRRQLIPDVQYDDFYAIKKPLPGQLVWIGYRASYADRGSNPRQEDLIATVIRQPLERMFLPDDADPVTFKAAVDGWLAEGRRAYRFTFAVGHFVCQIFGHNFPMGINVDINAGGLNTVLLPIWPTGPALSWPPPTPIENIGGLDTLHRAFDGPPS